MTQVTLLGLVAGVMTTVSFLPQLFKVWRSKSASDLSFVMLLILTMGIFLWLIYGLLIQDIAMILTHSVSLILSSLILMCKVKYQRQERRRQRQAAQWAQLPASAQAAHRPHSCTVSPPVRSSQPRQGDGESAVSLPRAS